MLQPRSFFSRISIYFGSLFVVCVGCALMLWYLGVPGLDIKGAREQRLIESAQVLEAAANQLVGAINTTMAERRGDVLVISESERIVEFLSQHNAPALQAELDRVFDRLLRAYPDAYERLQVIDPLTGNIVASTSVADVGAAFKHTNLLARAVQPGVVELIEEVPGQSSPVVLIVRQILVLDSDGYPTGFAHGLLVAHLSVAGLVGNGVSRNQAGYIQPGKSQILASNGDVFARFPVESSQLEFFNLSPSIPKGFEGLLQIPDARGDMQLVVFRHFPLGAAQGWTLIHYQSQQQALSGLNAQLQSVFMVGLLLIALALALTLVAARHLTQPLRRLAHAARTLGNGQMSARATRKPGDSAEFADLALAFNAMAERVEHNQQQLEAKVLERTKALGFNEERLRLAVSAGNLGIFDMNLETGTVRFNAEYATMLGYDPDTFVETWADWMKRLHPDDRAQAIGFFENYLRARLDDYQREFREATRQGDYIWVLSQGRIVERNADGMPLRMMGTRTNVTARKAAEAQLKMAASVFSHAREGILITDANGNIVDVNATFTTITGYSHAEALGQSPIRLLHSGRHSKEFFIDRQKILNETGVWTGEVWNRRKNGEIFAEMLTVSVVLDEAGRIQYYVALFSDITEAKTHQSQLEHIAHYDALTHLPNRLLLTDRLHQSLAQSQRSHHSLGVAFLDLDGFKAVNDLHGHDVGDQLLLALSTRMKAALREGDTLSRLGGDEFVAVLVGLESPQDCEPVLDRLLRAASDRVTLDGVQLQVSASVGVTIYPQDGSDADVLLRHADQAMYVAKQAGKNRYHLFDVEQDTAVKTQRESVEHIRQALVEHQFVLYYQPKVNMKTGEVVGAEALIRWQHPERGLLLPGLFLPVIEDHPISVDLGEWVIATALAQMAQWQALGLNVPVSVNIGARQLQHAGFTATLSELLAQQPTVAPQSLQLEVLETSALEDISRVSEVMHACQALGVRFALDDFGTGYSSLTYLKRLPAAQIKIDQSFVRDMLTDADDLAIVQGVIGLAKAFKREVIAEGVETTAHGELLLPMGCELAQGYGIARPMSVADFPAWVARWTPDSAWSAFG